jgi:hypothetical protein
VASQEKEDEVVLDEEVEEIIGRGDKKKDVPLVHLF